MAKPLTLACVFLALLLSTPWHAPAQSQASPPAEKVKNLLSQALDAANEAQDSEAKLRALQTILSLEVQIGNTEAAERQSDALNKEDDGRRSVVCEVAVAMARKGDVRGAFAFLDSENPAAAIGDWCFENMAEAQGELGDVDGVIATASRVATPLYRAISFGVAAQAAARGGKPDAADKLFELSLETARTEKDAAENIESLRMVAFFLTEANRKTQIVLLIPEMQSSLARIKDAHERDIRLSEIAESQGSAGRFDDADETIKTIKDANRRDIARDQLAYALINKGDLSGAVRNLRMIQDPVQRANEAVNLARARTKQGDLSGAFAIAGARSDEFGEEDPDRIYGGIAIEQGKQGKIQEANRTARLITSNKARARTLILIGASAPLSDRDHVATTMFVEARTAALNIDELYFRAVALSHLAGVLSSRSEFAEARKAADAISVDADESIAGNLWKHKGHALENIAYWQCKIGNCEDALEWVVKESSPLLRAFAIAGAIEAMLGVKPPEDYYAEEGYG